MLAPEPVLPKLVLQDGSRNGNMHGLPQRKAGVAASEGG
jgi:hypothetical protein